MLLLLLLLRKLFVQGLQVEEANCKSCGKQVFQMEQIKAEKAIWHKNCFRCNECNKQLKYNYNDQMKHRYNNFFCYSVDTYQSHEGTVYCKPHFKALFAPKVVEDDVPQRKFQSFVINCNSKVIIESNVNCNCR